LALGAMGERNIDSKANVPQLQTNKTLLTVKEDKVLRE
jgi:hypothetical protein